LFFKHNNPLPFGSGFFLCLNVIFVLMKNSKTYTVDEAIKALEYYCAYQERCHADVEKKLKTMRMIPSAQEVIILHLLNEKYLSEERFAKAFARGKFLIKKYGRIRITNELKQRKISNYLIKIGLQEIDEVQYIKTLEDLINKKMTTTKESNKHKKHKKITEYLLRKGFEYDLIKQYLYVRKH